MDVSQAKVKSELDVQANSWRNLLAFWLLGLCNNYGYVVMLSAAHDILEERFTTSHRQVFKNTTVSVNSTIVGDSTFIPRNCNDISTGAILLADILPCLLVKFTVPFLPFYVHSRLASCVLAQLAGFFTVAYSNTQWLTIVGVAMLSFSSGLGEATLLSHSHKYGRGTIVAWSSGTGGAGIIGAFSYAGLRAYLPTEHTLLVMIVVPVVEAVAFWLIMQHPPDNPIARVAVSSQEEIIPLPQRSIRGKLELLPGLWPYILPLTLVYIFEYLINQGLHELIQFDGIWLDTAGQYRWLQVDYQIGVFISRSSASIFTFKNVWLMAVLQLVNIFIFASEAIFYFLPSIWIVFVLTLWEGLLGGGAYVNTFYHMADTIPAEKLKDSLGIVSMSDAIGITIAGFAAMPIHTAICSLSRPIR